MLSLSNTTTTLTINDFWGIFNFYLLRRYQKSFHTHRNCRSLLMRHPVSNFESVKLDLPRVCTALLLPGPPGDEDDVGCPEPHGLHRRAPVGQHTCLHHVLESVGKTSPGSLWWKKRSGWVRKRSRLSSTGSMNSLGKSLMTGAGKCWKCSSCVSFFC